MKKIQKHCISSVPVILAIGCAIPAGCSDLTDPGPSTASGRSAEPSSRAEGARARVASWQAAALALPDAGVEPLLEGVRFPFQFVATEAGQSFAAENPSQAKTELAVRERLALVHTSALVARALQRPPEFETPRRGEIVASLGDDARGYVLTLRTDGEAWRIVRFEIRSAPAP